MDIIALVGVDGDNLAELYVGSLGVIIRGLEGSFVKIVQRQV